MIVPVFRSSYCLLFIAYFLLAFPSCKQKTDHAKEIARLDSAAVLLKEAAKVCSSVDTSALRASFLSAKEKLQLIRQKIASDTLEKKVVLLLSEGYEHAGNLMNLLDNKKYLARAIGEGEQRIGDLKHDLAEDLIEKNKAGEYVVNEMKASLRISEIVNKAIENAKTSERKLDSLKTEITHLADSLQSK